MKLALTTPFTRGSQVTRLQEACDGLGCDTGPNDGIFGPATKAAVQQVQRLLAVEPDGIVTDALWEAILAALDRQHQDLTPIPSGALVDIRGKHDRPRLYKCQRSVASVCSLVIHQTGCNMPIEPGAWKKLNAHAGVTAAGVGVLVNEASDWIWHAQGLSQHSIGIEIAGNFQGIDGNDRTRWHGGPEAAHLNDGMAKAFQSIVKFYAEELHRAGARLTHCFAHRQSCETRTADPGSEIWQRLVLPLGLYDGGEGYKVGKGAPIPHEWDVQRKAKYYGHQ